MPPRATLPRPTFLDRAIGYVSPAAGVARLQARVAMARYSAIAGYPGGYPGGYQGARRDRRATQNFKPLDGSANDAILPALDDLRARSRELVRNVPIATGALSTTATNVVGTGLQLQPRIDRVMLGLDDATADEWERHALRLWRHFSRRCDLAATVAMPAMQYQLMHSTLDAGDVFVLLTDRPREGDLFGLKLQVVEADRVTNPSLGVDRLGLSGGIESDADGRPVAVHVCNRHPRFSVLAGAQPLAWTRVPVYGAQTGRRVVLHLYEQLRSGQSRGVPLLAPVIEQLRQLSHYSDAELMAAVVNSCFAIVTKTEEGAGGAPLEGAPAAGDLKRWDLTFESGMVLEGLSPNESVESFMPGRPNAQFDAFFTAVVRQIAVAVDLSFEVLIRHFTASYSASRAALLEVWKFFRRRRAWFVESLCDPVYAAVIGESVERGYLAAPGWDEPLIREAWLGAEWIGPAQGQLNPVDEVEAAARRIALGASTYADVAAELTGSDFERNTAQLGKEIRMREEAGMGGPVPTTSAPAPAPQPGAADKPEDETREPS